ncbi:nuclear pore complex protein NUP98A-like [Rutidosis leptorrhynchoides]|uniref:nuclear pore complex protein NUP98A-like n=1 Tax=Rutidosis leptorrhynchoides TaxID=125765 RepID=UPI003A98FCD6
MGVDLGFGEDEDEGDKKRRENVGLKKLLEGGANASSRVFGSPPVFGVAIQLPITLKPVFGGPYSKRSGFDSEQSRFGALERGSRVADQKAAVDPSSVEKLVSICAMPAYEGKSHEELRWEHYKSTGKGMLDFFKILYATLAFLSSRCRNMGGLGRLGGFGLRSSAVPSTSSPVTNFSKGPNSISTTPVKPNPFSNKLSLVPTDTPTWKFPGPTQTATWKYPGPTSSGEKLVSISALPAYVAKSQEELRWEDYKSNRKGGFGLRSSAAPTISSTPMKPNPFGTLPTNTSTRKSPGPKKTVTWKNPISTFSTYQPLDFSSSANTLTPIDQSSNSMVTASVNSVSVSPSPLFSIPSINPCVSPMHQLTTTTFPIPKSASLTSGQPSTPSACCSTHVNQPANSVLVDDHKSCGLGSPFNQPTAAFTPGASSSHNFNGKITEKNYDSQLPFGTLPPKPHIFFEGSKSKQLIQYGISSMTVKDEPTSVRNPMLTARHLSRRIKLPVQKYDPKLNGPKTPFFSETREIPPADVFVPRENPRELVVFREMMWPPRSITKNIQKEDSSDSSIYKEDGKDDPIKDQESATVLDAPSKLQQLDYYTQPQVSELEANERAEPGFCSHVKDFVIGRHGYGSIKFLGETDVRKLNLETIIQFNYREVIVYMDESMKPPVGEGLNKLAEITLLNINCIDKRTGVKYEDGLKVDRYTDMLKKKAVAKGVEFMSYDAVRGEWKFRVKHF